MKQYKLVNNVVGWVVFAIAAFTYCSTVEPSASFWDCPEFITTAVMMEIGHPPGAPFFMLTGNLFAHLASDPANYAFMINIMSALLSAFCILFLFWTVTHLLRKLVVDDNAEPDVAQTISIMAGGVAAALAYAWSDTFWFSAVEGEVYAYSSMFTALVFGLILKWEQHADEPHSDRWLVLIFYLTGLSIGVHLLNLLTLPAIVLVYYFRRNPDANLKGSLIALGVSIVLVAAVLYGVVPGIMKVAGWYELLCVNGLHMPFSSGMVIYVLLLIAVVLSAIWATTKSNRVLINILYLASVAMLGIPFHGDGVMSYIISGAVILGLLGWALWAKMKNGQYLLRKRVLNTSLLCMLMLMIGYSSYAVIIVRSVQNPPMEQNNPEDTFTLANYLGRDQYGETPLFYGPAFSSQPYDLTTKTRIQRHENTLEEQKAGKGDAYDLIDINGSYVYPSEMKMLFPRMYSRAHESAYKDWCGGITMHSVTFNFKRDGKEYNGFEGEMPSMADNLYYFVSYQLNYMYWRYFLWNFAGRQNDIQGQGEINHGNAITGFPFIDNAFYGDQSKLPTELRENKGHNVFYCLPLILGVIGLFWQAMHRKKRGIQQFWIVFFLFFMTGLAIVLYLNQPPLQPRERDYAYAGSFYAFAIWIGYGVVAIADWLGRLIKKPKLCAVIAAVIAIAVPVQMVSQTWDDHDRSGRYCCRDFGLNYLNSLDEKGYPIIFTNGDNDTFPLWYNQDTEGNRRDARVCNLSYLQTDWYTDQMRSPAWDSPALPITWERYEYVDNMGHDVFRVLPHNADLEALKSELAAQGKTDDPFELSYVIDNFVRNPDFGFIPTDSLVITIDKQAVIESGMKLPNGPDSIPDKMVISLKGKQRIYKSEMMVYELLAHCNWRRPIYMSVTLGHDNYAGLDNYLCLEGLAYRVTPFNRGGKDIDADKMYDNMMNKFQYGGLDKREVYLDETNVRMCYTHRSMFVQLIGQLLREAEQAEASGDQARAKQRRDMATKALERCKQVLPESNVPYDFISLGYNYDRGVFNLPDYWHKVGRDKEAERVLLAFGTNCKEYLDWYNSLPTKRLVYYGEEIERYVYFMQGVVDGFKDCNSKQADKFSNYLDGLSNTAVGKVIEARYEQRRQKAIQAQQQAAQQAQQPVQLGE